MFVWVLVRHAYAGDEILGAYKDQPRVFESIAWEHPGLQPDHWRTISPREFRLRDPRVDAEAGYNLVRTEVS